MPIYERFHVSEWSALYVDGELDTYGDHYLVDDRIAALLGVEDCDSDAWLLEDGRTPRTTVEEIEIEQERRDSVSERVEAKMAEARALMEEAARIREGLA